MGYYCYIGFKVTGQVDEDTNANVIKAKLQVICAEYGLELSEVEEFGDEF